jgi:hypothetical protein
MMRTRIALIAALLVGLALVPTLRHSYFELKSEDGYTTTAINPELAGMRSRPSDRTPGWVKKTFDSDDWVERHYDKPGGGEVTLFVSRSYDLKRLYHHPELAVAYGIDLRDAGIEPLAGAAGVPAHILRGEAEHGIGLAAYSLVYGDRFVSDPYAFQLELAGELVFTTRKPMTLFFAYDQAAHANAAVAGEPLDENVASG